MDTFMHTLFPALIYGFFGIMGIFYASLSRSTRRAIKHFGTVAEGEVTGYRSYVKGHGRWRIRYRDITVVCLPPNKMEPVNYIITTSGHFTFLYRWRKKAKLTFVADDRPLLPEDVRQLSFDGVAGLIAGIILLLMAICAIAGYIAEIT